MPSLSTVAGVDEVGRGPLAGPVVACALIINQSIPGVTDSKKLSAKKRLRLICPILKQTHALAFGLVHPDQIDSINIHQATLLAMQQAVAALNIEPDCVHVDGCHAPSIPFPCRTIIQGDASDPSIGAASIMAKVYRDTLMTQYDLLYPHYGFAQHKGYPTAAHQAALAEHGPCPIHRKSFKPVSTWFEEHAHA